MQQCHTCSRSCPAHPAIPLHSSTVVATHNRLGKTVWYNICQLPFSKKLDSVNIYPLPKKNTAITLYHNPVLPNTVPLFYWQV